MTAFLIWLKTKAAAWLERPAAAIININHGTPAVDVSKLTPEARRILSAATTPRPSKNHPVVIYGPERTGKTYLQNEWCETYGMKNGGELKERYAGSILSDELLYTSLAPVNAPGVQNIPINLAYEDAGIPIPLFVQKILDDRITCADQRPEGFLGSKEHGLTAGQEVRLNSCDVWMTVLHADCCEADCAWFDGHTMRQDTFPLACITTTPPMPF